MKVDNGYILTEIVRVAAIDDGKPPGWRTFALRTGIREYDWKGKYWIRWGDAVREAGLTPNKLTQAYGEMELLEKCARLARDLGRLPVVADIRLYVRNDSQFPEWNTFVRRFGGKPQLIAKLGDFCRLRSDLAIVSQMCDEFVTGRPTKLDGTGEFIGEIRFVCLIKSGRFYKIGRSNSTGRRQYELAIQLPERVSQVHQIKTDDPVGIERYWHLRFEDKQRNGEWFELKASDASAFKRRKFM